MATVNRCPMCGSKLPEPKDAADALCDTCRESEQAPGPHDLATTHGGRFCEHHEGDSYLDGCWGCERLVEIQEGNIEVERLKKALRYVGGAAVRAADCGGE